MVKARRCSNRWRLRVLKPWAEYPGLRVHVTSPEYVFAMKAIAGRPEDEIDLRALSDRLALSTPEEALAIVAEFVPERLLTAHARFLVESLFEDKPAG